MMKYFYATRRDDSWQHLLDIPSEQAICGAQGEWHFGIIKARHFPGVPLCEECRSERKERVKREKPAALRAKAEAIRTFWVR